MNKKSKIIVLVVLLLAISFAMAIAAEDVVYDFPLRKSYWEHWDEGGARAVLKSADSKIELNVDRSPLGAHYHIQLYRLGLKIEEGQKYVLKLNATSKGEAEVSCMFHKPSPPWSSYQYPEDVAFYLSAGDNTKEEEFTATKTTDMARLTCYFGQNRAGTRIIISSLKLCKVNEAKKKQGE